MHGLVTLDDAGEAIRPAILWNDQRTGAECEAITTTVGAARLIEQMEKEGIVGAANHVGKREVLIRRIKKEEEDDEDDDK